jgi:nitrite reductase (NADH) large subunit
VERWSFGVMALPDEALICSCRSGYEGAICHEIVENKLLHSMASKKMYKGRNRFAEVDMVKDLINERKSQGVCQKCYFANTVILVKII